MKIEHFTNHSITNFGIQIIEQFQNCTSFSIATSFINDKAIDLLEDCLKKNKSLKEAKLLIGIYGCFNKKEDLYRLDTLAVRYASILRVHISKDRNFHWKFYHFQSTQKNILYIGSANFTTGGLFDNGELILKISDRKYKPEYSIKRLILSWEKEWDNSISISQCNIQNYPENENTEHRSLNLPFNFFKEENKKNTPENISAKSFVTYLTDDVKKSTVKAINNREPKWEKNSWEYFICNDKKHFEQCENNIKRVLIFSREKRNLFAYWTDVKDTCDLKTDDGRYFIAYNITGKKINIDRELEEKLKKYGINLRARKIPFKPKILGKNQVMKLEALLE